MPDLLHDAIRAIKAGDKATGKAALLQLTDQDPTNEQAWLWMSGVVDSDEERKACLQKVLAINPNNAAAHRGLQNLAAANTANQTSPTIQLAPQPAPQPVAQPVVQQQQPEQAAPAQVADTKICPYCAETIKAEAIYCRHCKRDLVSGQDSAAYTSINRPATLQDQDSLNKKIQEYTQAGWIIINRTSDSAQLKKPRQWSRLGLVVFIALPLLGGVILFPVLIGFALVGFLIVIADYLLRKEELIYITAQQVGSSSQSASIVTQPRNESVPETTKDPSQKTGSKKASSKPKKP
jgi:hypothetical protein